MKLAIIWMAYTMITKTIMTLTHFWGVGEEKPATLYEGKSPGKTATKFYQGIMGSF